MGAEACPVWAKCFLQYASATRLRSTNNNDNNNKMNENKSNKNNNAVGQACEGGESIL